MSAVEVDVRAGDRYAFVVRARLGGVLVGFDLRWHSRIERWIVSLVSPGGDVLSMPHVVQSGGRILADTRDSRVPSGTLIWAGPSDYGRTDIGQTLRLVFQDG